MAKDYGSYSKAQLEELLADTEKKLNEFKQGKTLKSLNGSKEYLDLLNDKISLEIQIDSASEEIAAPPAPPPKPPKPKQEEPKLKPLPNLDKIGQTPRYDVGMSYDEMLARVDEVLKIEDEARQEWEMQILARECRFFSGIQLKAIYQKAQQETKKFAPKSLDTFLDIGSAEREWVVAAHIPLATTLVLFADGGVGKTLLAYDICKSIATGVAWNGFPTRQGKVLIVQTDEPEVDTRERLNIAQFDELRGTGSVWIETDWQFSQLKKLRTWIEQEKPLFVMIDSLTSSNRSAQESETDTHYGSCLFELRDIANKYKCTIMVLHHENKIGGCRGSTTIFDNVSEVWRLRKPEATENLSPLHRILKNLKTRSGCDGEHQILLNIDDYSWQHEGDFEPTGNNLPSTGMPMTARLLNYLEANREVRFEPEELVHEIPGSTRDVVRKLLERHKKRGLIMAEERIRQGKSSGSRYKVYYAPSIVNKSSDSQ